jgi:hypothetical protein
MECPIFSKKGEFGKIARTWIAFPFPPERRSHPGALISSPPAPLRPGGMPKCFRCRLPSSLGRRMPSHFTPGFTTMVHPPALNQCRTVPKMPRSVLLNSRAFSEFRIPGHYRRVSGINISLFRICNVAAVGSVDLLSEPDNLVKGTY